MGGARGELIFSDLSVPLPLAGRRGYVPAAKLLRYHQAAEDPPPSPLLTPTESAAGCRRHSYTPEVRPMAVGTPPTFQVSRWCRARHHTHKHTVYIGCGHI